MIRKLEFNDIKTIIALEEETLHSTLGWEMLSEKLEDSFSYNFVYEQKGDILGYISTYFDGYTAEVLNFCVEQKYQNQGIGKALFGWVLSYFYSKKAIDIVLEVRKSNSRAIHFYELFGFKKIHIRRKYYKDQEDALVFQKNFLPFVDVERAYLDCFCKIEQKDAYIKIYDEIQEDKYIHNFYYLGNEIKDSFILEKQFKRFKHFISSENLKENFKEFEETKVEILHANISSIQILWDKEYKIEELGKENKEKIRNFLYRKNLQYGKEYALNNSIRLVNMDDVYHKIKIYCIYDEENIVGCIHYFKIENYAKIEDIYIEDDYHRQALLKFVFNELKSLGSTDVILDIEALDPSKTQYENMGFFPVGEYYMYFRKC